MATTTKLDTKYFETVHDWLVAAKEDFDAKLAKPRRLPGSIDDFLLRKTLGIGTFGRIVLCQHKVSEEYLAMKILEKAKAVKLKQIEHCWNERNILQSLYFPFIVKLHFAFQDITNLYIVMDFVGGGDLFYYLHKQKDFSEPHAKFYAAQIVLALEYLHYLDLIYRDLKPENIMISAQGYVKLADFGFCKRVTGRVWTFCGTAEYLAPEIILNHGYSKAVDWWSFGCVAFELVAGYTPFIAPEPIQMYENIAKGIFNCPKRFSSELKSLIGCLLQVDPTMRYGNLKNGVNDIKTHKWFAMVDWLQIMERTVPPPIVPRIMYEGDTSNFDKFDEEDTTEVAKRDRYAKEFENF